MPVLATQVNARLGELELVLRQVPDLDVLGLERDRVKRLVRELGEHEPGRRVVEQLARSPQRRLLAGADRGQIREPGDVVEVKVGQDDVETHDALEQVRTFDEPADPGARVDHHRRVPVAEQRARRLAAVRGEPATPAKDDQPIEHLQPDIG